MIQGAQIYVERQVLPGGAVVSRLVFKSPRGFALVKWLPFNVPTPQAIRYFLGTPMEFRRD
jgi:hypothetical protein